MAKTDSELDVLKRNLVMFEEAFAKGLKNDKMDRVVYEKIKQALDIKEREREQQAREQSDMALLIAHMGKSKIVVAGRVCPGVHIIIDSETYVVTDTLVNVEFVRQANEVVPLLKMSKKG